MALRIKHHITSQATTVRDCLAKHFHLDDQRTQELLSLGAIYSNKKRLFQDRPLEKGTYLRLHLQPKRFPTATIDWKQTIVHDTPDFLVFQKPAGIPVHATVDNSLENALAQLRQVMAAPLLVTQRLDIPVSGLMLFAKTPLFQRKFNEWLASGKVQKIYLAQTSGTVPLGRHTHYMAPSERSPKLLDAEPKPGWQKCELSVLSCMDREGFSEAEIELHTGRTHQIRAQLAFLGQPILGDRLYGGKADSEWNSERIALRSVRLAFPGYQSSIG